ncbi:MAG: hypothetical protein ACRDWE_04595, partial [Acidimicrobiales bacterium]
APAAAGARHVIDRPATASALRFASPAVDLVSEGAQAFVGAPAGPGGRVGRTACTTCAHHQ